MIKMGLLKQTKSLTDLARLLNIEPKIVAYILYGAKDPLYKRFEIPKKNGGVRVIDAPVGMLKTIQRQLATLLLDIQDEIRKEKDISDYCVVSHGFKKKFSIITNARKHRNKRYVCNVDLKDFFASINFGRVYGFFVNNKDFKLNKKVAAVIARIACYNNKLPQGSPCSPIVSDLICTALDFRLLKLAQDHKCTYSRYVDDLSFSTNIKDFPSAIAIGGDIDEFNWIVGGKLSSVIQKSGFLINPKKTRVQFKSSRQETTGLIVNKKISVSREYYHLTRAMCDNLFKNGKCYNVVEEKRITVPNTVLSGRLAFIHYIRKMNRKYSNIDLPVLDGFLFLYKQYLSYINFYANDMPLIIGEGSTDVIYLKAALNQLWNLFPQLVEEKDSKVQRKIKFFRYSDTTTEILDLSGGTGEFQKFLSEYRKKYIGQFLNYGGKNRGDAKNPVIILVDNDEGTKALKSAMYTILNKGHAKGSIPPVDGRKQFYHIYLNLYVVFIPETGNPVKSIEGLFDPTLLQRRLGKEGKTLNLKNNEKESEKYYSKYIFATHVVTPEQNKINFDGFSPLLKNIASVLEHYNSIKNTRGN